MKKLKKLKLQSFNLLSNRDMKNIIGASDPSLISGYICNHDANLVCSSASGVCGTVGAWGKCANEATYDYVYALGVMYVHVKVACVCKTSS